MKNMPKTLYHYCSVETFFKIIKNNSIWLSDVEKSNDALELAYMRKAYVDFAQIAFRSFVIFHENNNIEYDRKALELSARVIDELIDMPVTKSWVFCLSEKGDLLSQWRGYAEDGYGLSIGFDARYLLEMVKSLLLLEVLDGNIFWFQKVSYSKTDMINAITNIINPIECGRSKSVEDFEKKISRPLAEIDAESAFYKSESFKEEKEWRIALISPISTACDFQKLNCHTEMGELGNFDYIASRGKLISHFELKFKDMKKALNKIIIGPKCKVSESELKQFLVSNNLLKNLGDRSIQVVHSSSSYR